MYKTKAISIIFVLIVFQVIVGAQNLNYPVKKINGAEYYIYTVESQEGLYSISKKFGVKQTDIADLNPEVKAGLKAGQVLIVPKITANKATPMKTPVENINFTTHIVVKKQTLFSISRKYNVDIDLIKKYNPQIEKGLQEGDTLKIPVINNKSEKTASKNIFDIFKKKNENPSQVTKTDNGTLKQGEQNYIKHTVKAKETLYSISKLYGVEIDSIIKLNPGTETGLKTDTELKIPKSKIEETKISGQTNGVKTSEWNDKKVNSNNKSVKIAYLLPLILDQSKVDATNEKFVDFYAGSLLAINDAKKKGISFEIFVFDTERSELKMGEILNQPNLKKVDLIIGPAYANQVAMIGDFARNNKINTLIPFTSKIYDIDMNPYLFQFNTGMSYELKFVTDLLKTKYKRSNIIFAEIADIFSSDEGNTFAGLLKKELKKQSRDFSVVEITNSESTDFGNYLSSSDNNLIFFNTEKSSNINQFLAGLSSLSQHKEIIYFKQTGWTVYESPKLKSFYISPLKDKLNSSEISKYKINFDNHFNWSSSESIPRYDLLGYDLTNYFVTLLYQKGADFGNGIEKLPVSEGIQSDFKFERNSKFSGFINKQLFSIEK
ncbi:MAG: LysM peptidoglycan-binding domain-containing protein [Paludibacter sp.]|nr:LysM peptidoglycan-binding domain-containing protein [Paludibacter sp.]